eukprot:scaffold878_cov271-Pinguiococcus_pyrenoidosus.AAC.55
MAVPVTSSSAVPDVTLALESQWDATPMAVGVEARHFATSSPHGGPILREAMTKGRLRREETRSLSSGPSQDRRTRCLGQWK